MIRTAPSTQTIDLHHDGPLELDWTLRFLRDRWVPGIEHQLPGGYARTVRLAHGDAILSINDGGGRATGEAVVEDARDREEAAHRVERMLDLHVDTESVDAELGRDPIMRALIERRPGIRVPGTAAVEELAVRAVLGQQVSVVGARTLAGRLVAVYGHPVKIEHPHLTHTFPRPSDLADASLAEIGMPGARKDAIRALCGALADGTVSLDPAGDRGEIRTRLIALVGIGPWTADYIAMRALGDPDVFLASDLGVRRALERLDLPAKPAEAERLAERWRPWRSYAVQHLWSSLA